MLQFFFVDVYFVFLALEGDELNTANEIHVSLMLDFPSEVIQWMIGIKKLIHELIQSNESKKKKEEEKCSGVANTAADE